MIVDIVRCFRRNGCNHAVGSGETPAHVEWLPRAFFFVFTETKGVFGRRSLGGAVHHTWFGAANIQQDQLQSPTNGGIGLATLAKTVGRTVDVQFFAYRAIVEKHGRA